MILIKYRNKFSFELRIKTLKLAWNGRILFGRIWYFSLYLEQESKNWNLIFCNISHMNQKRDIRVVSLLSKYCKYSRKVVLSNMLKKRKGLVWRNYIETSIRSRSKEETSKDPHTLFFSTTHIWLNFRYFLLFLSQNLEKTQHRSTIHNRSSTRHIGAHKVSLYIPESKKNRKR